MSTYIRFPSQAAGTGSISTYASAADLPISATDGAVAVTTDTQAMYVYKASNTTWYEVAAPSTVISVGTIDSLTAVANGAQISSNALIMQSASATQPGLVNTGVQSFAGAKTFTGAISASNLSGTNTGDITLAAVGSSPNANGASLTAQALNLQPANGTNPGVVTAVAQTIGGAKTFSTAPILSSLTASLPLKLDGSKNILAQAIDLSTAEVTGILAAGRFPALTGDITTSAGSLTTAYNGVVPLNKGGTGTAAASANAAFNALSPLTTLGDIIYGGASGAGTRLAGDTSNANRFLRSVSSAGVAAAPSWAALVAGDIPSLAASIITSGTLATAQGGTNLDTSASTGVPSIASGTWSVAARLGASLGGTNINTSASTGVPSISSGTWSVAAQLAISLGGTGQATAAAGFDALSPLTALGDIIYGGASGTRTRLAGNITTTKKFLTQTGDGANSAAPAWGTIVTGDLPTDLTLVQTLSRAVGCAVHGTNTNDNGAAGYIGEYIESIISGASAPSAGTFGDLTNISLTAGDWDVTFMLYADRNSATGFVGARAGISVTSGNSSTGLTLGSNYGIVNSVATGVLDTIVISVANYRVSLSGTTTHYAKILASYSTGTPQMYGRLSARRVR